MALYSFTLSFGSQKQANFRELEERCITDNPNSHNRLTIIASVNCLDGDLINNGVEVKNQSLVSNMSRASSSTYYLTRLSGILVAVSTLTLRDRQFNHG